MSKPPDLAAESVQQPRRINRMHRQIGSPATTWQTPQSSTTSFERATPSNERDLYTLPETIALNSQSDQSLREAVEVESSRYLGSVALTNERQSKILQAAHLAIADQSPFNLRNTDPKISIRDLNLKINSGLAPQVVAEASSSKVPVPLPPRASSDAAGSFVPRSEEVKKLTAEIPAPTAQAVQTPSLRNSSTSIEAINESGDGSGKPQSYRGVSHNYFEAKTQRDIEPYSPAAASSIFPQKLERATFDAAPTATTADVPVVAFNYSLRSSAMKQSISETAFDNSHLHGAWGHSEEAPAARSSLNSLFPGMSGAPKKASVSFEAGMPAQKPSSIMADNIQAKAIKSGDALQASRIGAGSRLKDSNRLQGCANLPMFDTNSMRVKFQGDNVTFSKSISPSGERMQVQTAADFSSITETWTPGANGAYSYKSVYRDELNRVRYEESVNDQGSKVVIQTGYCDREDKKSPFVAYRMMIHPDGTRELIA